MRILLSAETAEFSRRFKRLERNETSRERLVSHGRLLPIVVLRSSLFLLRSFVVPFGKKGTIRPSEIKR